jgi:hypothetical protein
MLRRTAGRLAAAADRLLIQTDQPLTIQRVDWPTLERYIFQFRLGPTRKVIKRLTDLMPSEQAAMWTGDKTARASGY